MLLEILGFKHEADLGGCFGYIQTYAQKEEIGVTEACMRVLDRTCAAVGLILDTAEQMNLDTAEAIHPENENTPTTPESAVPS